MTRSDGRITMSNSRIEGIIISIEIKKYIDIDTYIAIVLKPEYASF